MKDEETRMLPFPELGDQVLDSDWGTPSVGVGFVGETHFGDTHFGVDSSASVAEQTEPEVDPATESNGGKDRVDRRVISELSPDARLAPVKLSTPIAQRLPRAPGSIRVTSRKSTSPRPGFGHWLDHYRSPLILLGALSGGALGVTLGLRESPPLRQEGATKAPETAQVHLTAQTPAGQPLPEVSVRFRSSSPGGTSALVLVEGGAAVHRVSTESGVRVEADCPPGFSGPKLSRMLPQALLASGSRVELSLLCQPEMVQVPLFVQAKGCGEVDVRLDGELLGRTEAGIFRQEVVRGSSDNPQVLIQIEATTPGCTAPDLERRVTLPSENPKIEAEFELKKMRRPPGRRMAPPVSAPVRPYKL